MILTQPPHDLKCESADALFEQLKAQILDDVPSEQPAHVAELRIWRLLLQLGYALLQWFFHLRGTGNLGPTVALPEGTTGHRLDDRHHKRYVSIFGEFRLERMVYGSREGQKIDFVSLDNRLQLPESDFSYVLQDWDQNLCVEQSFGKAASVVGRILETDQHVDLAKFFNFFALFINLLI